MNGKLGDVLRDLRLKNNLTQDELANKMNVTRQTVSSWERGKSLPDIEMISIIASFFDVSVNDLLLGEIRKVNNSLRKYKIILWILVTLSISVFLVIMYNMMYPSYKTNIKNYMQECSDIGDEYSIYIGNFEDSIDGNNKSIYIVTKPIEVEYDFGVYCVPVDFKFSDFEKNEEEQKYENVEVSVPFGFLAEKGSALVVSTNYTDGSVEWRLIYAINITVQEKTSEGIWNHRSEEHGGFIIDLDSN